MKYKSQLIAAACVAALAFGPVSLSAAGAKKKSASASASPAEMASPKAAAARPVPFHGMVSEVDQTAKTFTIGGKAKSRVFKVTDNTVITKGTATATIADITQNEKVSGSYWKAADGSLEAKTVKVGATATAEKKAKKSSKKMKESASPAASPSS